VKLEQAPSGVTAGLTPRGAGEVEEMPRRLGAASGGGQARRSEAASPLTKEDLVADRGKQLCNL
jgi:hypothetical protein